ncbi:MAG: TerC/Alx family metal homeostasis membrane protein [Alphaproteobacteria bacterium]|nr:TerC/Alx family metal homeostasis membrane protein [Alphaproteobacteria bacterium]
MFGGIVCAILFLDLGILEKKAQEISAKNSVLLFSAYAGIACLFGLWIYWYFGASMASEFFTGYIVEMGLSIDNVFVISLVFSYLAIPRHLQHRVLFWGILGAAVLRGFMFVIGAEILDKYDRVLLIFAVFLIYSGLKMLFSQEPAINLSDSRMVRFFRHYLRVTNELHEEHFFVRLPSTTDPSKMKWYATPLLLALLLIEFGDALFAIDSVPAMFAVSHETFALYSSDMFAVLGLRALYFLLSAAIHRFSYLQPACAVLLVLIGVKVFVGEFFFKVDDRISLAITFILLFGGVLLSLVESVKREEELEQKLQAQQHDKSSP